MKTVLARSTLQRSTLTTFCPVLSAALLSLPIAAFANIYADFGGENIELHTTVIIKPDGTATLQSDASQPRATAEQQIQIWERYEKNQDADDDEVEKKPAAEPATPKPLTDDAIATRLKEMMEGRSEFGGGSADTGNVSVKVTRDTVQILSTRTFTSLEELLGQAYSIWQSSGLMFDNLRLDKDSDGHLRATFIPRSNLRHYTKSMRQQFNSGGVKELKLVFPGKILSSGFPQTDGNSTGMTIDPRKEETINTAIRLFDAPTVITAELTGLKLDQPLESKTLQRQARRGGLAKSDLPITDAGPGFVAEPVSVTTTTVYYFPEAGKRTNAAEITGGQKPGMLVMAKFFAPKGRTLQSVSGVRVLNAKDDKGRELTGNEDAEAGETFGIGDIEEYVYNGRGSGRGNSTQIRLQLDLPQADAQSIDELSGEAIATTAGGWKEMTVTNIQAGATNDVDLGAVLPGAKIAVTRFSNKNGQVRLQAQLRGPKDIRRIEIELKSTGENFSSSANETRFNQKGAEATRNVLIQGYGYTRTGQPLNGPISLLVRYPQDVRRERVKFKLTALDLL